MQSTTFKERTMRHVTRWIVSKYKRTLQECFLTMLRVNSCGDKDLKFKKKYLEGNKKYPYLSLSLYEYEFIYRQYFDKQDYYVFPILGLQGIELIIILEDILDKFPGLFIKFMYWHEHGHFVYDRCYEEDTKEMYEHEGYRLQPSEFRADAYACKKLQLNKYEYKNILEQITELMYYANTELTPFIFPDINTYNSFIPSKLIKSQIANENIDEFSNRVIEYSKTL